MLLLPLFLIVICPLFQEFYLDFNDNVLDIVNEILAENIVEPIQEIQEFPVKTSKKSKQV